MRALAITKRQAQILFRAAEAERGIVEVKIGDAVFRLIPECRSQDERPIDADNIDPTKLQTLDEYEAWRKRSHAGEA